MFGGACHELAAKVALARRDQAGFRSAAAACAKSFVASRHPILIARHQRLLQDAERTMLVEPGSLRRAEQAESFDGAGDTTADDGGRAAGRALAKCPTSDERIARALALALAGGPGPPHGMLYLMRNGTLHLERQCGACPEPARMDALVAEFLRGEIEGSGAVDPDDLVTSTVDEADWIGPGGARFAPALLSHPIEGGLAISGVLVFDVEAQSQPRDALLARLSLALSAAGDVAPLRLEAGSRA